ncbi:hypothetical protein, partial [Vibrio cyclitrophicus]
VYILIVGLSSGFAFAGNSDFKSMTQCAELLPDSTYSVNIIFNVKDNDSKLSELSVSDVNAKNVLELPKGELKKFTKCMMPLVSDNPLTFDSN